jgi:hypothetical protein
MMDMWMQWQRTLLIVSDQTTLVQKKCASAVGTTSAVENNTKMKARTFIVPLVREAV